jgi:hypothetical protein
MSMSLLHTTQVHIKRVFTFPVAYIISDPRAYSWQCAWQASSAPAAFATEKNVSSATHKTMHHSQKHSADSTTSHLLQYLLFSTVVELGRSGDSGTYKLGEEHICKSTGLYSFACHLTNTDITPSRGVQKPQNHVLCIEVYDSNMQPKRLQHCTRRHPAGRRRSPAERRASWRDEFVKSQIPGS